MIITFREQPGDGHAASVRAAGGEVRRRFRSVPAMAARLSAAQIQALRNSPSIASIEPDVEIHALDEYSSVWGVVKVGSPTVHSGGNYGGAVNVCVLDTGIDYTHVELTANYAGGYDFVNDDSDPLDDNGHGTHVAGTIAAVANGANIIGVAPQVKLFAYKVLDSSGSGNFSDVIAALEACQAAGGKVTSNSYGSSTNPGSTVQAAFDRTYNAGVLHVAAAGNSGSGTDKVNYPGKYASVIAVAATDSSNARASFSSTGPTVELAAPGVSVLSTYLNGQYATASGASMATPHVSGVAALVLKCGLNPATPDTVRARLPQAAQDLGSTGRDNLYGYELVRADLAAMNCQAATPTKPAAPSNLVAANGGSKIVNLSWLDKSSNETAFVLERCKVSGISCSYAQIATPAANATSYTDSTVSRRTYYRYRLKARNSAGDSADVISNQIYTQ